MKKMNNKGFSLVELIIVIAIMAILAGALAPALIKYIAKSRRSSDVNNAGTIQASMQTALSDETAFEGAPIGSADSWTPLPKDVASAPTDQQAYWEVVDNDLSGGLKAFENCKTTKLTGGDKVSKCKFVYMIGASEDIYVGIDTKRTVSGTKNNATDKGADSSVSGVTGKVLELIPNLSNQMDGKNASSTGSPR